SGQRCEMLPRVRRAERRAERVLPPDPHSGVASRYPRSRDHGPSSSAPSPGQDAHAELEHGEARDSEGSRRSQYHAWSISIQYTLLLCFRPSSADLSSRVYSSRVALAPDNEAPHGSPRRSTASTAAAARVAEGGARAMRVLSQAV